MKEKEVRKKRKEIKRAIKILNVSAIVSDEQEGFWESLSMANSALKKQIPKKIFSDTAFGRCPNCLTEFNSELINEYDMKYCIYCGQALDHRCRKEDPE